MRLPNGHAAIVDRSKLTDYLLSPTHPVGRFKAAWFAALGYGPDAADELADALRQIARTEVGAVEVECAFGRKFEMDAVLSGALGSAPIVTVWIIDAESQYPRLVTAFPK